MSGLRWALMSVTLIAAVWLLSRLLERGSLTGVGWVLLSVSMVILLFLVYVTRGASETERARFLRLVQDTEMMQDPERFVRHAPDSERESCDMLRRAGFETSQSPEGLAGLTLWLKERGEVVLSEPRLLELAAAHFGQVLSRGLGGRWRVRRRLAGKDAVVSLGCGKLRHDVSPGVLVMRAIEDSRTRLEDVYEHEERELS